MAAAAAAALAFGAVGAQASTTTYSGQDDGAPTTGPFPNSAAAQASFLTDAATHGPVYTETFENVPVGAGGGGGAFGIPGASVTLVTPFAAPYGGVNAGGSSNVYGFNITPGGQNWLGFANGSATFNFSSPTHSFGFYTTGVQTVFTSSLTLDLSDGSSFSLPINVNGGASYFGVTDTVGITSATITNISDDAWGIDDVSYNFAGVPEPASWALMLLGVFSLGGALRKQHRKAGALAA